MYISLMGKDWIVRFALAKLQENTVNILLFSTYWMRMGTVGVSRSCCPAALMSSPASSSSAAQHPSSSSSRQRLPIHILNRRIVLLLNKWLSTGFFFYRICFLSNQQIWILKNYIFVFFSFSIILHYYPLFPKNVLGGGRGDPKKIIFAILCTGRVWFGSPR